MEMKAQAAMEYLMTYGWAILIIIVVVAALYGMGVFSGGGAKVPCNPCFSYFAYVDHSSEVAVFKNGPRSIQNIACKIGGTNGAMSSTTAGPGDSLTCTITIANNDAVTITYDVVGGLSHSDTATLYVAATGGGGGGSDRSVCQNADDGGLCEGLDLLFGEGYRLACCTEFELCCKGL